MNQGWTKKGLCKLCKEERTENGHDPCIANLPGVLYACCGHGVTYGYIKFTDGRYLRFQPLQVELDLPQHEVVSLPVPVHAQGETFRILHFKTGKKTIGVGKYRITGIRGSRVMIRRRKET